MNRTCSILALAASVGIAWAVGVPYSPDIGGGTGEPGSLQWHGDPKTPYLSVEDFSGARRAVTDPFALRREQWSEITTSDYSVTAAAGIATSNGLWVVFDGIERGAAQITRTITVTPSAEWLVRDVDIDQVVARNAHATVEIAGGRCVITCRTMAKGPPPGESPGDLTIRIARVLAARAFADFSASNDLTMGDCPIIDGLGETSIGGFRPWVLKQLDGHRAEDWSDYAARAPVRLSGQPLHLDVLNQYRIETTIDTNSLSSAKIMMGATEAVTFAAEVSTNSIALRIMGFEFDPETREVFIWCSNFGNNHVIEASNSALSRNMVWQELATEVHPGNEVIDGVTCVLLTATAPAGWDKAFFRVGADLGETRAASIIVRVPIVARAGIVLEAPNGTQWKLKVDDDGTLSTEAW